MEDHRRDKDLLEGFLARRWRLGRLRAQEKTHDVFVFENHVCHDQFR